MYAVTLISYIYYSCPIEFYKLTLSLCVQLTLRPWRMMRGIGTWHTDNKNAEEHLNNNKWGPVVPLVFGHFGEFNKELLEFIGKISESIAAQHHRKLGFKSELGAGGRGRRRASCSASPWWHCGRLHARSSGPETASNAQTSKRISVMTTEPIKTPLKVAFSALKFSKSASFKIMRTPRGTELDFVLLSLLCVRLASTSLLLDAFVLVPRCALRRLARWSHSHVHVHVPMSTSHVTIAPHPLGRMANRILFAIRPATA